MRFGHRQLGRRRWPRQKFEQCGRVDRPLAQRADGLLHRSHPRLDARLDARPAEAVATAERVRDRLGFGRGAEADGAVGHRGTLGPEQKERANLVVRHAAARLLVRHDRRSLETHFFATFVAAVRAQRLSALLRLESAR